MTRDMTNIFKTEHMITSLNEVIDQCKAELQDFAAKLAKDPHYYLRWSNDAYKNAAKQKMLETMIWELEQKSDKTEWTVQEWFNLVNMRALEKARSAHCRSSNYGDNAMDDAELNLWASYSQYEYNTIFKAQRLDAEYNAWWDEKASEARRAEEQRKNFEEASKRIARNEAAKRYRDNRKQKV